MRLNIPTNTKPAFDRQTISGNPVIRPAYTSANIGQAGRVQPSASVPVSGTQSTVSSYSVHQSTAPVSGPSTVPPMPSGSTLLRRGQKFAVEDHGQIPSELKLLLNWDVMDSRCDLDASAFLLGSRDLVPAEDWFVFYGQPESPDRSIRYSGNTGTGAEMHIHLSNIHQQIQKIAFAVTIYEAIPQRLHFGMVRNVSARLINAQNQSELARMELTDTVQGITALVVGELYRYKGVWKFNAVGSGVKRDLAGFCAMYGIEIR